MEQERERSSAKPLHPSVEANEKEAFGSHSTTVTNFAYLYVLDINTRIHLTVCKQLSYDITFKNKVTNKQFVYKSEKN